MSLIRAAISNLTYSAQQTTDASSLLRGGTPRKPTISKADEENKQGYIIEWSQEGEVDGHLMREMPAAGPGPLQPGFLRVLALAADNINVEQPVCLLECGGRSLFTPEGFREENKAGNIRHVYRCAMEMPVPAGVSSIMISIVDPPWHALAGRHGSVTVPLMLLENEGLQAGLDLLTSAGEPLLGSNGQQAVVYVKALRMPLLPGQTAPAIHKPGRLVAQDPSAGQMNGSTRSMRSPEVNTKALQAELENFRVTNLDDSNQETYPPPRSGYYDNQIPVPERCIRVGLDMPYREAIERGGEMGNELRRCLAQVCMYVCMCI